MMLNSHRIGDRSMFKKMMAKLGKGAAKVDLILAEPEVPLGGTVKGDIIVQGGEVSQTINTVEVKFHFEVQLRETIYTHLIAVVPYQATMKIRPGQSVTIPFQLPLPYDLLISSNSVSYFFTTHLDIAGGIDSSDRDYIQITPPWEMEQIFAALYQLGFREKTNSRTFNGEVQEFIFSPTTFLSQEVTQLRFSAILEENEIHLILDLDLGSFFDKKTQTDEISVSKQELQDAKVLAQILRASLEKLVYQEEKPSSATSQHGAIGKFVHDILSKTKE